MRRNAISSAVQEEEAEINMTPMLDVVFIMLIFFIVTANFIKEPGLEINRNISIIQTCIVLAPLLGLLGTVTGMIEVFQVMAFNGGGDARAMAGGVSKATLPTMAGMVAAVSGSFAAIYLTSTSKRHESELNEIIKREI